MFAGVTYSYFIINAVIAAELFLVFRSIWVLPLALVIHGVGVLLCLREPRIIDLWLTLIRRPLQSFRHGRGPAERLTADATGPDHPGGTPRT